MPKSLLEEFPAVGLEVDSRLRSGRDECDDKMT